MHESMSDLIAFRTQLAELRDLRNEQADLVEDLAAKLASARQELRHREHALASYLDDQLEPLPLFDRPGGNGEPSGLREGFIQPPDRLLTRKEAQDAYEAAEPVPLSEERIREIVDYATASDRRACLRCGIWEGESPRPGAEVHPLLPLSSLAASAAEALGVMSQTEVEEALVCQDCHARLVKEGHAPAGKRGRKRKGVAG